MMVMDTFPRQETLDEPVLIGLFSITKACGYCKLGQPAEPPAAVGKHSDADKDDLQPQDDDGHNFG